MLFLRTFGGLSIENGGSSLAGAAGQRGKLILLAVIAAAGERGISREKLHGLLWPESDFEHARKSLNQALFALRRDLDEQDLFLGTGTLRLNPRQIGSDVGDFQRLLESGDIVSAVNCYAGPLLDGVPARGGLELDHWIDQERQRLKSLYENSIRRLATEAETRGDFTEAIDLWKKFTASDPFSSAGAASLMRALATSGDPAAAIRHGRTYGRFVREQLEVDVPPEVEQLSAQIASDSSNKGHASRVEQAGIPDAPGAPGSEVAFLPTGPRSPSHSQRFFRSPILVGMAGVVVVAMIVTGAVALVGSGTRGVTLPADANRVVVIPFENRTGDPSLEALGLMGADWIADALARTQIVAVVDPRSAVEAFYLARKEKGKDKFLREIVNSTGASILVEGSFYRRGDSLEFHARVVDGETNKILGSIEPVTVVQARASDGVDLQRQKVLGLLAQLLDARLSQVVLPEARPPSLEAYREFVMGVDKWSQALSLDSLGVDEVRGYFRRAFALDTTFVTPLIWLTFTYDYMKDARSLLDTLSARRDRFTALDRHAVDYFQALLKDDKLAAIAAAQAGSDLAPRSQWSFNAGTMLFPLNRPHEVLKYLLRLDPNHGWMSQGWEIYWYWVAQAKHMVGDLTDTRDWVERARRKFPKDPSIAAAYARALALTGQPDSLAPIISDILRSGHEWRVFYAYSVVVDLQRHGRQREAIAVWRQILPWYQAQGNTTTESDRRDFARLLFAMNMEKAAIEQFERLITDFPTSRDRPLYSGHLADVAAMHGDSVSARKLLESVPQEVDYWPGALTYWRARVAARLGHQLEAVHLLRESFAEGGSQLSLSHSTWYDFPTLQGYPPFEALVASR